MAAVATLKRRSQFQRVRGGGRCSTVAFVLEGKARSEIVGDAVKPWADAPQFGFTVTKKLGNAVVRSRIRRRLKAAVAATSSICARANYDYVLIAREPALDRAFSDILADLTGAFARVHMGPGGNSQRGRGRGPDKSGRTKAIRTKAIPVKRDSGKADGLAVRRAGMATESPVVSGGRSSPSPAANNVRTSESSHQFIACGI